MGIPKFFRWISERYPLCSDLITENRVPDFDCLYLDMNGVIHQCSHSSDEKLITSRDESEIFLAIFAYVQALFDKIRPKKLFFLAVDGVAPRAKMNQQRSRRFRTAGEKAEAEAKAERKDRERILSDPATGVPIGKSAEVKYFDTNCITPGTEFMERLTAHLCYFIAKRVDEDPTWRSVKVIFSGPECPGEGEHKIMEWIRADRARSDHEANLKHCLYGLDADLIMLGLLTHEPHCALLREEVTFGRKSSKGSSGLKSADQVRFYLLHLGLMREYLGEEFGVLGRALKFPYDFERVLDDFVLLSLFVGNDFLPHLPNLHIHENALGLLFDAYKSILPSLTGYLNDAGRIDMKRCAQVLGQVVPFEKQVFEGECADELESLAFAKAPKPNSSTASTLPPITAKQRAIFDEFCGDFLRRDSVFSWECDPELIANHPEDRIFVAGLAKDFRLVLEFTEEHSFVIRKSFEEEDQVSDEDEGRWKFTLDTAKVIQKYEKRPIVSELQASSSAIDGEEALWVEWKSKYYADKMSIRMVADRAALLQKYCEGLEWVMAYYYEGVASWSWYFPYHYAPFLSDVVEFLGEGLKGLPPYQAAQFKLGRPFAPFEQLMGVLPSLSSALVPAPLAELMTAPDSPILHFFPSEYESDMNGKKNSWEAIVKIPFIEEDLLVKTLAAKEASLSEAERRRNRFGPAFTFEFVNEENLGAGRAGNCIPAPSSSFEALESCRVRLQPTPITSPSRGQLRKGLTPGVGLGVSGPASFPTLQTLPYSSALQHLDVQVFQNQASKSLTLALVITSDHDRKYSADPRALLQGDSSISINYPHLMEAQLVALTDGQRLYCKKQHAAGGNHSEVDVMPLTDEIIKRYLPGCRDYSTWIGSLETRYAHRFGIILAGGIEMVAVLHPFKCLKMQSDGAIVKEFDESRLELVPLQMLLIDSAKAADARFQSRPALSRVAATAPDLEKLDVGEEVLYVGTSGAEYFGQLGRVGGFLGQGPQRRIKLAFKDVIPALSDQIRKLCVKGLNGEGEFTEARDAAKSLNIPSWLLSKLTSTFQVTSLPNRNVVNLGLNVKFEGKSRAVPQLARRNGPGRWEYARKLIEDVRAFQLACPDLFKALQSADQQQQASKPRDSSAQSDRPVLDGKLVERARGWLDAHGYPTSLESALPCDHVSMIVDGRILNQIAEEFDRQLMTALIKQSDSESMTLAVPLDHVVPRDVAHLYSRMKQQQSEKTPFRFGDRVTWTGDGADGIPFGCQGIVVGVFAEAGQGQGSSGSADAAPAVTVWILLDRSLRGIGSDLNGNLPAALKHRGMSVSNVAVEKLLNCSRWKDKPAQTTGKTATKSAAIKVNASLSFNAAHTAKRSEPAAVAVINEQEKRDPVDILNAIFRAATTLAPTEAKSEMTTVKAAVSDAAQTTVKKRPAVTASTAKISYSTKTKQFQQQQ